ncbi:PucR family transcriptional regulator [Calidifontibacter terrae]
MTARTARTARPAAEATPLQRIVDHVEERLPEIVATSVERYFEQVPAYAASPDPQLRANATVHTQAVFEAVLRTLREERAAEPADFPVTGQQALRRLRAGLTVADFLAGFRIGQVTLWEGIVAAAGESPTARALAIDAAAHVMRVIEVGSSVAATAFVAAQQSELAEDDRIRRDLIEDLLVGHTPSPGPRAALAKATGLTPDVPVMVVVAESAAPLRVGHSLRSVLTTVRATLGSGAQGVAAIRQDQIVGILPVTREATALLEGLNRAHRLVARQGIQLMVGASTIHPQLSGAPAGFREALLASQSLRGEPGVRALWALSTLDYLVIQADDTAHRLIRPELRRFIEEDAERDAGLVDTLLAYIAHDLNAKTAAEQLHVHVNTAYYRLDRIAERTGCDLRSFADLQEMLIAIRLLRADGADPLAGR